MVNRIESELVWERDGNWTYCTVFADCEWLVLMILISTDNIVNAEFVWLDNAQWSWSRAYGGLKIIFKMTLVFMKLLLNEKNKRGMWCYYCA